MKLQVIVTAIAMIVGTAAYADIKSVTTTTVSTTAQPAKAGVRHQHHGKYHRHYGKKHHHHNRHQQAVKKRVVKRVVTEEYSPPGSVTVIQ